MADEFKVKVTADLDTSEAEKKLDKLTKDTKKVKIDVDDTDLDGVVKKTDGLKNKKVSVDTNVKGGKSVDSVSKSFDRANKSVSGFGNTIKGFAKFGAYLNVFQMIEQGAKRAVTAVKEIDDAIVDLQVATNGSYDNVNKLVRGYNDLAKELGATTTEVSSGADTWLRQGETIANTNKLIKDTMVLSKDAKLSSDDSSKYLTAIRKGYKVAVDEVSSINDSLTSIDMAAAVDAGGLAEATSRVAASAELAGVSLNKLLGYEAAVGEASQEGMSVIGNSFKTIFQRMSDIKVGKLELVDEDGTTDKLSDVELVLDNVGIKLRDSANEFRSFDVVLDDTAKKWDSLSSVQKASISKAFAGGRQMNRFQLLMENYNKALEYANIAENSKGTALEKFNDAYLNSLEAKQKSLHASFESLSTNMISRDSYAGILEASQALVEFLDKTNLAKGALAGLAVGGALKGFVSITTGITQATMKMQNFQKALDFLKAGNIGTDGIEKLVQYTDGLSKSQLKAVLSSTELSTAQRMQILTSTGMSEAQASATLATMGLATAEGTATASTLSLGTAMKGLYSTLLANPLFLVGAAVTVGVSAWQSYKQSVEDAISSAKEAGQRFQDNFSSLHDQISTVQELKTALASGTLSEEEAYQAKSQLLDIQNQLTDSYGSQASNIDLVNGELEKQVELMNQLAVQDAKEYLNKNEKAINKAEDEMTKNRQYDLGSMVLDNSEFGKEIKSIVSECSNIGLSQNSNGEWEISFSGDASKADEELNSFMSKIRELRDEAEESGKNTTLLDSIIEQSSDALSANKEIIDEYQEIYKTSLQSDMISKGFGDNKPATVLDEYTKAIDAYNKALASGDTSKIDKTKASFDDVQASVDGVLKKYPEYQTLFDDVENSLNETAIKAKEFKDILGEDGFKDIISQFKNLKDVDLKGISFSDDVTAEGEKALKSVVDKAIELGIVSDDSAESIVTVVDMLVEMEVTGSQSAATLTNSFEQANTSIQSAIANVSSLKDILSESVAGAGISAENLSAFREMFGEDAESALEKTANGYHINEEALAKLQKRQAELTKSDYLSAIADQQEALRNVDEEIAKSAFMNEDISGLQAQRQEIVDQISSLQDLQLQYEAAFSAYQQWQDAMSGGEEGDMYDSIQGNVKSAQELYSKGLVGTNKFKEFADLMSNKDLSSASTDEVVSAYEAALPAIQRYFTEGQNGAKNFLEDVQNLNSEWAHMNEDGSWDINFGNGKDEKVADALGIDVEAVQSILRKLSDYGFDINLDQPVESLEELKSSAQSAKESLEGMGESGLSDIDFDTTSFSEITDDIDQVKEYINTVNESDLDPEVKTERLEYANEILEYLVEKQQEAGEEEIEISVNADELEDKITEAKQALEELKSEDGTFNLNDENVQSAVDNLQTLLSQKEQLNSPAVMSVDVSQVDGELGSAIAKIQEYQSAVQELNVQNALKAQGVEIDTSEAEAKVQTLAGEIQGINPEIKASLGIDTTSLTTLQTSVAGITPQIMVKAGVDSSAITGYVPQNKESTVKFKVDSSLVDLWSAPNKSATVKYSADYSGITNPPKKTQYVQVVETKKATGTMLSMKSHASGTLHAHANGRVALPRDERALVNELGTESRIRDGVWEPIQGGMHVEDLKKGDIIINAKQTEELIKNGKVSESGGLSAYSSGSGKFNTGSSGGTSRKKKSSGRSGGSNSGSSGSEAEKATEEVIDWIAVLLDRVARITDLAVDAIDRAVGLVKKQTATANAISKTQNEIAQNKSAANRYLQQANSVGLNSSYASKVQNGTLDIEIITSEDLKEKISKYKEYYENYLDSTDKALELEDKLADLIQRRLENIEDYYDTVVKVNEELTDAMDAKNELNTALGTAINSGDTVDNIKQMVSAQKNSYNQLYKKLTEYQNEFNSLVSSGKIKQDSEAYYESLANINAFNAELSEAAKTLIEFEDQLREINNQTIEYLIDGFKRNVDKLDAQISLIESRDQTVPESIYQEQMDSNNAQILKNDELLASYLKEQALYDVNSERYQELAEKINDVDIETLNLMEDNEKLKDSIFELRFKPLDDAIDKYNKLSDELEDFYDLLNENAFFDKQGRGTSELAAGLALITQQMKVNKQKISDYTMGLNKLQESFDNGVISEVEYNEKSEEYREGIRDSISANKDLAESISGLYLEQMEKEIDYLDLSIDKRKEAFKAKESYYSYNKKIKESNRDINMLKSQIAVLEGTTNRTSLAEAKRLREELKQKEQELSEVKREHSVDMQEQGYDKLSDDIHGMYESVEYDLIHSVEKQEEIIRSMLNRVVGDYADAYGKINQIIGDTGWVGSGDFNQKHEELGTSGGASSQVDEALKKPPQYKPSDIASGTVTTPIKDNSSTNSQIESDIMQKPNTDNRPIAELKVGTTSVTLEEGKSTSVATAIRPTDAKNKTLSWKSSNDSVATASNGTIKAIAPGSCQIIVSTTDGSGLSCTIGVTVTKKPDPPKPAPPPTTSKTGSNNGIAEVGDMVTFTSGRYYYDSYGVKPSGNQMLGKSVYLTKINPKGNKPYHISKGPKLGSSDLGWVTLSQLKGYKTGARSIDKDQLAWTQEDEKPEIIIRKSDGAMLTRVNREDTIFNSKMTDNLWQLAKSGTAMLKPENFNFNQLSSIPSINSRNSDVNINLHYDNLLNVQGDITKESFPGVQRMCKEACDYTTKHIYDELKKSGFHR